MAFDLRSSREGVPAPEPLTRSAAPTPTEHSELDLRSFLRIVRRRMWVVVLVPVIATIAAAAASSAKTPQYQASAAVLLGRTQAEILFDPLRGTFSDPNRLLANQIRVIQSRDVADFVQKRSNITAPIQASASKTEDVITLTSINVDAKQAAAIANAYADAYIEYRRSSTVNDNAVSQTELRRQIDAATAKLAALDQDVAARPLAEQAQVRASQTDRETTLTQLDSMRTQLSQLQSAANVDKGGAQLLARADVPTSPFEPKPLRSGFLGLSVGLMLAVGLALLLDYLDNGIRDKEDLERSSGNLPVLGLIPVLPPSKDSNAVAVVSIEEPKSGAAEAYRSLRTSIQFVGLDLPLRTIQVTSPATSEGKTTTLANLAVALARAGQRVIAVDLDLRRPRLNKLFDLDMGPGFTSVLVGKSRASEALKTVPGVPNLLVLPAGPIPPNPSELLSSKRTVEILAALRDQCDVLLIDSPPVLPVSDASVVATLVDATLVVLHAHKSQRRQLARSLELLQHVDATPLGTVLNRVDGRAFDDYGYNYGYYYQPYTEEKSRKKRIEMRHRRRSSTADFPIDAELQALEVKEPS